MARMLRLLLVEDDQVDAKTITGLLRQAEAYQAGVATAESFGEAAPLLRRERYDAVLLDLGLPDSFELETLAKILPLAQGVPVIVISGLEDQEFAAKARRQGAAGYLFKDGLTAAALEQAITKSLTTSDH
ncbi:MAG: response regulator [Candidatus Edwardsbacteria bacterium]|jgi:DNA-binding NarL/FixJ family response regulator|nr:response regulator [Candidatus Edwardsbacteria bacterium]